MPRKSADHLDWGAILRDFRSSGLTHVAFCQLRRLPLHTFRRRLYQAPASLALPGPNEPPADPALAFLPVTVLADTPGTDRSPHQPLELILPYGRRVAVAPGFDADTLRRLLSVLEGPPCSD